MLKKIKKDKKFYAYQTRTERGISENWEECRRIVENERGARYKSFKSFEEAENWLENGAQYEQKSIKKEIEKERLDDEALYFDSGTGGKRGVEISVSDKEGTPLAFLVVPEKRITEKGTMILDKKKSNNFGELAALYLALLIAKKLNKKTICGDSKLVIDYWSKGHISKNKRKDRELTKGRRRI
ncbi:MAG: RNase H1/viroplasmin domain-containing protein [Acidobacteria bacterium]|nr:RNase H1/viroplasmin domain-containing protein [Acidobacteriota bacterium]